MSASTLFALTPVTMLLVYAAFGAYCLGQEFKPPINDLVTALYYAMVTMGTVDSGDVIPQTPQSKLSAVSVIILGVAEFGTSSSAVIAPMISNSLQRIVSPKSSHMNRERHLVVIGNGSLAINTAREPDRRGHSVTRVMRTAPDDAGRRQDDFAVGDPSSAGVMREAGANKAKAVLDLMGRHRKRVRLPGRPGAWRHRAHAGSSQPCSAFESRQTGTARRRDLTTGHGRRNDRDAARSRCCSVTRK